MSGCDEKCWTQVDCEQCGRPKQPAGRSVPLAAANGYCDQDCAGYRLDPQPPHLWDEHDDARHYTDPDGWAAHETACSQCRGDDDD